MQIECAEEETCYVLVSCKELLYKGKNCHMMCIRDLSTFYRLQKSEKLNSNLNMLNATVTQNLTSPLNCVATFSEKLSKNLKDEKDKRYVRLIHRSIKLVSLYIQD